MQQIILHCDGGCDRVFASEFGQSEDAVRRCAYIAQGWGASSSDVLCRECRLARREAEGSYFDDAVEATNTYKGSVHVEFDREDDGRWIADVTTVRGALAYGATREEALIAALKLARDVLLSEIGELCKADEEESK